jgi:hypothetical protein
MQMKLKGEHVKRLYLKIVKKETRISGLGWGEFFQHPLFISFYAHRL